MTASGRLIAHQLQAAIDLLHDLEQHAAHEAAAIRETFAPRLSGWRARPGTRPPGRAPLAEAGGRRGTNPTTIVPAITTTSTTSTTTGDAKPTDQKVADLRRQLDAVVDGLGLHELGALLFVVDGLAKGRSVYGELNVDADPRSFRDEAAQEVRDSLVYLAAELVRLHRRAK